MNKCMCLRVSDDTKSLIVQFKDELGFKTQSALLNEFFYFLRHGKNFPGSKVDMSDFLSRVLSGDYIQQRSIAERVYDLDMEMTLKYISVLEEEYGDNILSLIASDGISSILDGKNSRWMLNIQHTIMEKCDVGLLDNEVREICLKWFRDAKRDGKISELQKNVIARKWAKMEA